MNALLRGSSEDQASGYMKQKAFLVVKQVKKFSKIV